MTRQTAVVGVAFLLACVGLATNARAADGTAIGSGDAVESQSVPQAEKFFSMTMQAGGQLDPGVSVNFAGQASHLGQFTASGTYDASIDYYGGTIVVSATNSLNWRGQFYTGAGGEPGFFLNFGGGTGIYTYTSGHLNGSVAMDADSMFTIDLEGDAIFVNFIEFDTTPCSLLRSRCQTSCEDSTYNNHGVCEEESGDVSAISIECCCCTDGWQSRSFIGG